MSPHDVSTTAPALVAPDPDIASAASRLGTYAWLAAQLFEVVGGWVATTDDTSAKVCFGALTSEWAWHAELWRERLPELAEVDRHDLAASPGGAADEVMARLAGMGDVAERIRVLDALCERLDQLFAAHQVAADPVRDAPALHTLALVRSDLAAARRRLADLDVARVTTDTPDEGSGGRIAELIAALDGLFIEICARRVTLRA